VYTVLASDLSCLVNISGLCNGFILKKVLEGILILNRF
jgi:hypothetical protein